MTKLDAPAFAGAALKGRWRLFHTPAHSGAVNMAIDHALMARARRTGESVLRVYTWSAPTLSLGRHQSVRGRVNPDAARELGVSLVRRPTGGRALLHHREVTYSVTSALGRDDSVRTWYASINTVLLRALHALGVNAETAAVSSRTPLPATASCFVRPDEGEITVGGRKLVGSALLLQEGALLQHGSILLDDDQPMLNALLPADELPPAPAGTLRQALGVVPSVNAVADALFAALAGVADVDGIAIDGDDQFWADVNEFERQYASNDWTFRH